LHWNILFSCNVTIEFTILANFEILAKFSSEIYQ
jgi:hypothetical protein